MSKVYQDAVRYVGEEGESFSIRIAEDSDGLGAIELAHCENRKSEPSARISFNVDQTNAIINAIEELAKELRHRDAAEIKANTPR